MALDLWVLGYEQDRSGVVAQWPHLLDHPSEPEWLWNAAWSVWIDLRENER